MSRTQKQNAGVRPRLSFCNVLQPAPPPGVPRAHATHPDCVFVLRQRLRAGPRRHLRGGKEGITQTSHGSVRLPTPARSPQGTAARSPRGGAPPKASRCRPPPPSRTTCRPGARPPRAPTRSGTGTPPERPPSPRRTCKAAAEARCSTAVRIALGVGGREDGRAGTGAGAHCDKAVVAGGEERLAVRHVGEAAHGLAEALQMGRTRAPGRVRCTVASQKKFHLRRRKARGTELGCAADATGGCISLGQKWRGVRGASPRAPGAASSTRRRRRRRSRP